MPEKPFPHRNKKGSISKEFMETKPLFHKMQRELMFSSGLIVCSVVLASYAIYKKPKTFSILLSHGKTGLNQMFEAIGVQQLF